MLPVGHRAEVEPKAAVLRFALLLLSAAVAAAVALAGEYTVFLATALLGGLFGVLVLVRPVLLLYFVIPFSAAASVFREVSIPIGNTDMTLSGLVWLCIAFIIALSLLIRFRHLQVPRSLAVHCFFSMDARALGADANRVPWTEGRSLV